ncbi:hypothetical protein [Mycobacterium sp.]|uniref:hypothetical protein n=1 Tax=Mycobacterium sp. TaxID=1785 RepID=UPI003A863D22
MNFGINGSTLTTGTAGGVISHGFLIKIIGIGRLSASERKQRKEMRLQELKRK